eukprot:7042961-Alexandrium_andersonii.AAC.1
MSASLVGSEMCIRDRNCPSPTSCQRAVRSTAVGVCGASAVLAKSPGSAACLLYTSDAADDM